MKDSIILNRNAQISRPPLLELEEESFRFDQSMPIWEGRFGDNSWPFYKSTDRKFAGKTTSAIVWHDFEFGQGSLHGHWRSKQHKHSYCLTQSIINDLKTAAAIYALYPRLLKNSKNSSEHIDPMTVKGRIDKLASFLSFVIVYIRESRGVEVTELSEIEFSDIKECVIAYGGRGDHLNRALRLISDPYVQLKLSSKLQWSIVDIDSKSIYWPPSPDRGGFQPLNNEQFSFLIKRCSKYIAEFKILMGMDIRDEYINTDELIDIKTKYPNFVYGFEEYFNLKTESNNDKYRKYINKFGYGAKDVGELISNAHSASMLIILLLTAMRRSEVANIEPNNLVKINGYSFIVSYLEKKRKISVKDQWLATELTVDAYEILNMLCENSGDKYIFTTYNYKMSYGETGGYTLPRINEKLKEWIESIDDQNYFKNWRFHIHQCRESLVYQLARHEVKLPFISMQVKHFSSRLSIIPNDITAGYGNYKKDILNDVQGKIAHAREDAILEIYGEGAALAGGGAKELVERIDAFFAGMKLHGASRIQYLKKFAHSGARLFPTSIGSCLKGMSNLSDGSQPPCFGDYQCSPDCQSHILSKSGCETIEIRKNQALKRAESEADPNQKSLMLGLASQLDSHLRILASDRISDLV
jgi:hypothetical protein